MKLPYQYSVLWADKKGDLKVFETNDELRALKVEVKHQGTTYIDTRFDAKMRLFIYSKAK